MKFILKTHVVCMLFVCMFSPTQTLSADREEVSVVIDSKASIHKKTGATEYITSCLIQNNEMSLYETSEYSIRAIFGVINPKNQAMGGGVTCEQASFESNGILLKGLLPWKPEQSLVGIRVQFMHKSDPAKNSEVFKLKPLIEK